MAARQPLPQREGMETQESTGEGFVVRRRSLANRQEASQLELQMWPRGLRYARPNF
jgi:hypothetical protein